MSKIYFCIFSLFLSSYSFALMCPNNFNQINVGDTLEQVQAQCGKPTSQSEFVTTPNVPQEWTYNVTMKRNPINKIQATSVIIVTLDDKNNVTNLVVNGAPVSRTSYCDPNGRRIIAINNTAEQITAVCGKPTFTRKGEEPQGAQQTKITEVTYSNGPTMNTLLFENGVLKGKK